MNKMKSLASLSLLSLLSLSSTAIAHASTLTVNATDVIDAAGNQSSLASTIGGTVPSSISVSGVSSLTFSVSGTITMNSGGNINDADGVGAGSSMTYVTSYGSLNDVALPGAGDLVGVFIAAGGPSGSPTGGLDFTPAGATSFTSLSPGLNQIFFIGDGLTGDKTGSTQTFYVPTGASQLYLGIADACGYYGSPGCYGDNSGSYSVTVNPTYSSNPAPTPEPSTLELLGTGLVFIGTKLRRRFVAA